VKSVYDFKNKWKIIDSNFSLKHSHNTFDPTSNTHTHTFRKASVMAKTESERRKLGKNPKAR
jgi:hypothetical protein